MGNQPDYTEAWSEAVVNGRGLWKKCLPAGTTVEFDIGLQGAIIVNAMLAAKESVGYLGDMPAIVRSTNRDIADLPIVANLNLGRDQCNVFFMRNGAPSFVRAQAGIKWLEGKTWRCPSGAARIPSRVPCSRSRASIPTLISGRASSRSSK